MVLLCVCVYFHDLCMLYKIKSESIDRRIQCYTYIDVLKFVFKKYNSNIIICVLADVCVYTCIIFVDILKTKNKFVDSIPIYVAVVACG